MFFYLLLSHIDFVPEYFFFLSKRYHVPIWASVLSRIHMILIICHFAIIDHITQTFKTRFHRSGMLLKITNRLRIQLSRPCLALDAAIGAKYYRCRLEHQTGWRGSVPDIACSFDPELISAQKDSAMKPHVRGRSGHVRSSFYCFCLSC